jgi:hypothetical protein
LVVCSRWLRQRASWRRNSDSVPPTIRAECRMHPDLVGGGIRRAATSSAASSGATTPRNRRSCPIPPAERGRGCRSATTATGRFEMILKCFACIFVWPALASGGDSRFQTTLHALRFSASFNQELDCDGLLPCAAPGVSCQRRAAFRPLQCPPRL